MSNHLQRGIKSFLPDDIRIVSSSSAVMIVAFFIFTYIQVLYIHYGFLSPSGIPECGRESPLKEGVFSHLSKIALKGGCRPG
jgi:hypothetical protein